MGDATHTPGPWYVFEHRDHSGLCIGPRYEEPYFKDGEVRDVCVISGRRASGVTDQNRIDAHLVAAAPDLLAFAREVERYCTSLALRDLRDSARVAIAKAIGA